MTLLYNSWGFITQTGRGGGSTTGRAYTTVRPTGNDCTGVQCTRRGAAGYIRLCGKLGLLT